MQRWICRECKGLPVGGEGLRPCPEHPDQILVDLEHFTTHKQYKWLGRLLGNRYGLFQFLGGGGFGQAFCALDTQLLRPVAIKIFRPVDTTQANASMQARFYREARLLAQLNDPNIVTIHDLGVHDGVPYFAMEWIDGDPWKTAVRGVGPAEIFALFDQVLSGLSTAHTAGIIHRDIKPANIMVTANKRRAVLIDFGIAKPEHEAHGLTEAGKVFGTPRYMAPEVQGGRPASPRSDIYAIGVLLSITVGAEPDPRLDAIIQRATAFNPDQRYQSVREMATELRRVSARLDLPTTRFEVEAGDAASAPTIGAVASRIAEIRTEAAEHTPIELRPRETKSVAPGDDRPTRINTAEQTVLTLEPPTPEPEHERSRVWVLLFVPLLAVLTWVVWQTQDTDNPGPLPAVNSAALATTVPTTIAVPTTVTDASATAPTTIAVPTTVTDALATTAPVTAAPATTAPATTAPATTAPATTVPPTTAPAKTAPITNAPVAKAPTTTPRRPPKTKSPTPSRRPWRPKVSGPVRKEIIRLMKRCECNRAQGALKENGGNWRDADAWEAWIYKRCKPPLVGQCTPPSKLDHPR